MECPRRLNLPALNSPISLDSSFLRTHGREVTDDALRHIVCSVKFEVLEQANAVRLLGPEMSYHRVDPYLPETLEKFKQGMTLADVLSYTSSTRHFDLSFEDSWTGYFIAKRFRQQIPRDDLVLIHLDDHTDMMPTLLCRSRESLTDPTTDVAFDPTSSSDWEAAIYSGVVSIGNFITPLYYSGRNIHVRHINNSTEHCELAHVSRESCRYELIPERQFAAIAKSSLSRPGSVGTYLGGSSPDWVLDGAPQAWTLIHIDLDYFINDFNGGARGESYTPDPMLRAEARRKMNRFFHSLAKLNPIVDRWLIATSPGFCSACHWEWLLSEIEGKIQEFEEAQVASI